MFDILQAIPTWYLVGLFLASMVAFVISTILGGGGALLLIPVTSALIGTSAAPPVINLGNFISRLNGSWIQLLVGAFLISIVFQYRFGKVEKSFNRPKLGFVPLGLITVFIRSYLLTTFKVKAVLYIAIFYSHDLGLTI